MDETTRSHEPVDGDADLQALRALGRGIEQEPVDWLEPPEGLWERIAAAADVPTRAEQDTATPIATGGAAAAVAATSSEPAPPIVEQTTDQEASRSISSALPWMLTLAAVLALVALTAGVLLRTTSEDDLGDATILAQTSLDLLGDAGSGRAELLDAEGTLHLRLETADLDPGDGFLELWVIDPDVTKLVSLGPLRSDGVYELPSGLDPAAFPVVDISVEPIDGDPTHSGDSVLRGVLEF